MKKVFVVLLLLPLFLSGCYGGETRPTFLNTPTYTPVTMPDRTPSTQETTTPTTQPATTAPTEESTAPTYHEFFGESDFYKGFPAGYSYFMFDGKQPWFRYWIDFDIDLSGLQIGVHYIYNAAEDRCYELGVLYDDYAFEHTKEYIYYVLASDPGKILRSDYQLKETVIVFDAHSNEMINGDGIINCITYYGLDGNGSLVIVVDNRQVLRYDLPTKTTDVLLEQYYITYAMYTDSWPGVFDGPTVEWSGKVSESDTAGTYWYEISTGKLEKMNTPND